MIRPKAREKEGGRRTGGDETTSDYQLLVLGKLVWMLSAKCIHVLIILSRSCSLMMEGANKIGNCCSSSSL